MHRGLVKYQKYYAFIDETDTYYTVLILDPRIKRDLLLRELSGDRAAQMIVDSIRENMYQKYHYELVNKDFIVSVDPILDIYNDPEVRIYRSESFIRAHTLFHKARRWLLRLIYIARIRIRDRAVSEERSSSFKWLQISKAL